MSASLLLLVDDDPGTIRIMGRMLADLGPLRFATSGAESLRLAHAVAPDLILLDAEMPGMSGFQVCRALKSDPTLADVPVIFVSSHTDAEFEIAGFEAGAADFIAKPVSAPLVLARVKAQLRAKHLADELRRVAFVDPLTGVTNRGRFEETLGCEWLRARRSGEPMSVLMIDVDHFKLFNDRYGHPAGDACLRGVAQALGATLQRPADLVARYGGEEFALLLPNTPRDGAEHMAQRVLDAVAALEMPHAASPTAHHVTASVGIASYDNASACWVEPSAGSRFDEGLRPACSAADLVRAADQALYAAKTAGRAQGRSLDVADIDVPGLARQVASSPGLRRAGGAA